MTHQNPILGYNGKGCGYMMQLYIRMGILEID
jgi:hypothetical protein